MAKDAIAARIQDNLDRLPQDEETQALSHGLSEVRAHLAELVTHVLQGRAAVQVQYLAAHISAQSCVVTNVSGTSLLEKVV